MSQFSVLGQYCKYDKNHSKDTRNCPEKAMKISHFNTNQSAPSIYIMLELCYFSLDQWEIWIHLLWGKCFNIPHHCDPHLNQTKFNNLLPLTIHGVLTGHNKSNPECHRIPVTCTPVVNIYGDSIKKESFLHFCFKFAHFWLKILHGGILPLTTLAYIEKYQMCPLVGLEFWLKSTKFAWNWAFLGLK